MKSTIDSISWVHVSVGAPYHGNIVWVSGIAEECRGEGVFLAKATRRGFKILSDTEWFGRIMHETYYWAPYEMPSDSDQEGR